MTLLARLWSRAAPLLGGKAAAGVFSLAYLAIAARALGPHDYGVLVLLHAYVMTVDAVMNLQAWQVMVRHGGASGEGAARLLGPLARLEGLAGLAAVGAAALLAPVAGAVLGWPAPVIALAGPYSFAALANARSIPGGYLQAVGRFDLLGAHHGLSPAIRLIGAGLAATAGWGLTGFVAAWLIAALAEWSSMWIAALIVLRRREGALRLSGSLRDIFRRHPGLGRYMLACKADAAYTQFAPQILPLVVGATLGPAAAGVYAIAARACQLIAQPAQLVAQAAFSEFVGRAAAKGEGLMRTAAPVMAFSLGGALIFAVPLLAFPGAVTGALGGPAFAAAGALLVWLALARLTLAAGPVLSAALAANGRADLSVAANLGSTLALLPILPPVLRAMGPLGAGPYALGQAVAGVSVLYVLTRTVGRAEQKKIPAAAI